MTPNQKTGILQARSPLVKGATLLDGCKDAQGYAQGDAQRKCNCEGWREIYYGGFSTPFPGLSPVAMDEIIHKVGVLDDSFAVNDGMGPFEIRDVIGG